MAIKARGMSSWQNIFDGFVSKLDYSSQRSYDFAFRLLTHAF